MDARFERRAVRPKCALELVIPIGPIFVDDFLQYGLENFIGGFCKSVRLWVVRGALLVHNRVVVCELTYYVIDEVSTLVTNELDWASITAPKMLVHEFSRGCRRVVSEGFSLDPFGAVVRGHDNILIPCTGRGWLERAYKIQTPFLKWVQRENRLVWHP